MLSDEDNNLLTRVGPDTMMGNLLRRYWQPVLYSYELPERDAPPVRVRLLGEDLIAFRDTSGKVGLMTPFCPHRGASLFYGRNEENGLRCVYHGWKFDVNGTCVDMPNDLSEASQRQRIRAKAYPCREQGGIIWTYMGPQGEEPGLPDMEWINVPDTQRYMTKRYHECNWAQGLEGDLDSSHVGFLHSKLDKNVPGFGFGLGISYGTIGHHRQPKIEVTQTDFGLWVAARRPSTEDQVYWRLTALVLPFYAIIPGSGNSPLHVNIWQPIDDENTMVWSIQYHGTRVLDEEERAKLASGEYEHYGPGDQLPQTAEAGSRWRSTANRDNDFQIDREAQKSTSFTGLRGFWRQDRALVESMGQIADRSIEHLGASDLGIIRFRRMIMQAARSLAQDGTLPPGLDPVSQRIRSVAAIIPENESWEDMAKRLAPVKEGEWVLAP